MPQQLCISEIHPQAVDWRCNILVLEKWHEIETSTGRRIQKLVFANRQGNRVLGLLWNNLIDLHHGSLLPYKKYCIGGATVALIRPENARYSPGLTHEWTITMQTYVRLLDDNEVQITHTPFPFLSCMDMMARIGTNKKIDILAVVTDIRPVTQRRAQGQLKDIQECILINQELRPIILTLWRQFVTHQGSELMARRGDKPIILATKLIPTSYSGLSLGTTSSSFLSIEPDIPEAHELRTWARTYPLEIMSVARNPNHESFHHAMQYREGDPVTLVKNLIPESKNEWVRVSIQLTSTNQRLTYTACPQCKHFITASPEEIFDCYTCETKKKAQLKCRIELNLTDKSGTIVATIFEKLAEETLGYAATVIHGMEQEKRMKLLEGVDKKLQEHEMYACIRTLLKKYEDKKPRYSIQQIQPRHEAGSSSGLPPKTPAASPDTPPGFTTKIHAETGNVPDQIVEPHEGTLNKELADKHGEGDFSGSPVKKTKHKEQ